MRPCASWGGKRRRSLGRHSSESRQRRYIGRIVNNRKEVIQCLIVSRRGRFPRPGSSTQARSAPLDAVFVVQSHVATCQAWRDSSAH